MASEKESHLRSLEENTQREVKCFTNLWPAAQKVSLLFRLSYLNLGSFPEFEVLIRRNAVRSSELFSQSSSLLGKCSITGQNIISSLLPVIRRAVDIDDKVMVNTTLRKTHEWIQNLLTEVDQMAQQFAKLKEEISENSKIVDEKKVKMNKEEEEVEKKKKEIDEQLKVKEECIKKIEAIEEKLNDLEAKKRNLMESIEANDKEYGALVATIPWFLRWVFALGHTRKFSHVFMMREMQLLESLFNKETQYLREAQENLSKLEQAIFDEQLEMIKRSIQLGIPGDSSHLKDLCKCLSNVQLEIEKVKKFWNDVKNVIEGLQQKHEGVEMLTELQKCRQQFHYGVDSAEKIWLAFSKCCMMTQSCFDQELEDKYEFLELDIEDLSPEDLDRQIKEAKNQLQNIRQQSKLPALPEY